jgi:hypothetical protein
MDTTYVPTYLTSVERDSEGWPKFVTTEQRGWLTTKVTELLMQKEARGMEALVYWVFHSPGSPRWPLLDAQYAAVHRALLETGARQVWTL